MVNGVLRNVTRAVESNTLRDPLVGRLWVGRRGGACRMKHVGWDTWGEARGMRHTEWGTWDGACGGLHRVMRQVE